MAEKRKPREAVPVKTVIERLRAAVERLREAVPVDCVYLYGSYARGDPKPYSDVDVAVISPAFGRDIVAETVMLMEFLDDGEMIVEPRAYSREEYEAAAPGTFLRDEVIDKGLRIA